MGETPITLTGVTPVLRAFDFDVDTAGKIEAHQRIDRFVGWFEDIDEPVMSS